LRRNLSTKEQVGTAVADDANMKPARAEALSLDEYFENLELAQAHVATAQEIMRSDAQMTMPVSIYASPRRFWFAISRFTALRKESGSNCSKFGHIGMTCITAPSSPSA
jgi:hypothetical protein